MDRTVEAAIVALFGVVISLVVSRSIANKAAYLSSVTVERSKWIDKLRTNLSEFLGSAAYLNHKVLIDNSPTKAYRISPDHDELVRKLETLDAFIRLQLNPFAKIDQNIIALLDKIPTLADTLDPRFRTAFNLLIRHSQWLLKDEWEKVKFESNPTLQAYTGRWRRTLKYLCFCWGDGSLSFLKKNIRRTSALLNQ